MSKIIKNRKLNRLKGYDYSTPGYYFVTIRTKGKHDYFGKLEDEKVILNKFGKTVKKFWMLIPDSFKNVVLDEFIIMPDHIHGIIILESMSGSEFVGTEHRSVQIKQPINYGLLSKAIKLFKEKVTKYVKREFPEIEFGWQRSFYDHIIRNEKSFNKIRDYIKNNAISWKLNNNSQKNFDGFLKTFIF